MKAITAITFLATPHRGTHLAQTLNRILQSSIITSSKQYVTDLMSNSLTLQKLNEQFRHIVPKLDIVSFYETQPTAVGLKNTRVMVLEKDSSVLGYPGETSKALDADHHGVAKYDSPSDPNYVTVRNVLRSIMMKIAATRLPGGTSSTNGRVWDLKELLSLQEHPDTDYILFQDQRARGTNDWILADENFLKWINTEDPMSRTLWLHGGPATGKSVLSSFIVNHLVKQGKTCQYFYIRFGDQAKRSFSLILCSIVYQMTQDLPQLSERLVQLANEGIDFSTAGARTIWERIFKSILFHLDSQNPAYWVIDGLDEADDSRTILRTMLDIGPSSTPIRILFTSRRTMPIQNAFGKFARTNSLTELSIEGHVEDFQAYIRHELCIPGTEEFKLVIQQRLLDEAGNNFLVSRTRDYFCFSC